MRVLAIVNLSAGQGDAGFYEFLRHLGRTGAEIVLRFISGGTTMRELTRDAASFDRVVAAGGDGTVSGVCHAVRETGVPVLVYPAGTANLLALNLKMPIDPALLAHIALAGETAEFDIGELTVGEQGDPLRRHEGFMVAAGAGFDARIMQQAQDLKPSIGAAAYIVGALQNLAPTVSHFELTLDGRTVQTEGIAVLVTNFARLQFDLPMIHASDPSDGVFEVVIMRTRNAIELIPAVWSAIIDRTTGSHPDRAGFEIHTASSVRIEATPALPLQYDGEVLAATTPVEMRVTHCGIRLLIPPTTR